MTIKKWYEIQNKSGVGEIMIYGEIGSWDISAKDFAKDLKVLGNVKLINVQLNSPGGSVIDGIAIYNSLKNHPARIVGSIDSVALSMGSVIAMSFDHLAMAENALFMIHNPFGMAFGDADEMRKTADVIDKMKANIIKAYVNKTGTDAEELSELMDSETWYDADEALEAGFIDEVTGVVEMAAHFEIEKYGFKNTPEPLKNAIKQAIMKNEDSLLIDKTAKSKFEDAINKFISQNNGSAAVDLSLNEEVNTMPKTEAEIKAAEDAKAAEIKAAADRAAALALKVEADRQQEIRDVFKSHGDDYREILDECIASQDVTVENSRQKLLDAIGKGSSPATSTNIHIVTDSRDNFRAAALESIEIRNGSKTDDGKNEFRGATLLDIAKASLRQANVSTRGMDKMRIVGAAFTHSTSDLPFLLENSLGKELRTAYGNFAETWSGWCDTGSVPDFKSNSRIQLGSFNSLDLIPEGGEYDFGSFGEEAETIQAQTKGKGISLTRQMIINDDLGGFMRIARMMGRAGARTIGADVYTLLKAGTTVTMSDGVVVFHAGHGNLPTGAAPTAVTVGAARTLMRKQKDPDDNDFLNIQPAYIISGVELEDTLNVLIASETDPSQANSKKPNPVRNIAELITDPRLGATEWYMVANANEAPLIEVAFLDGNQTPYLESQNGFTVDGIMWKVRLDYGLSYIDYRGGVKGNA